MIELDHLNLMVSDVARSRRFYEPLLAPFGYRVNRDFGDAAIGLGNGAYAILALVKSDSLVQPIHLAFRFDTWIQVAQFHSSALELGGKDNGPPGLRPHYHESYYAAFIRDPDGHNLEGVCHLASGAV
jgi:predicted lactoylglutathione lyase